MRLYWHDIKKLLCRPNFSIEVFEVTEDEYAIVERIRCISFEGELPWDSRWRRCSVAKQPKQLLRTLMACVLLPALTLRQNLCPQGCQFILSEK